MATKNLSSVFIGLVDILGYKNAEKHIDQYGPQVASAIIEKMYNALDTHTSAYNNNSDAVHWIRYCDGYVFFSETKDIEHLATMVKDASHLIALSLCQSIPLRIAITQGDIKIVEPQQDGLSITGSGWSALQILEKSLDWMGGWLYLPNYDGVHHDTVQNLIQTTLLVKNQIQVPEVQFNPPFKKKPPLPKNAWFVNWQKILQQPKDKVDQSIKSWWSQFKPGGEINKSDEVKRKQKNSIDFADYCRALKQAANLLYHSGIDDKIDIGKI